MLHFHRLSLKIRKIELWCKIIIAKKTGKCDLGKKTTVKMKFFKNVLAKLLTNNVTCDILSVSTII